MPHQFGGVVNIQINGGHGLGIARPPIAEHFDIVDELMFCYAQI